jgi:hypothetical protein
MSTEIIKLNRGDSLEFYIDVTEKYDDTKKYLLKAKDVVYFALLYPHQSFEEAVILKGYTLEDQDSLGKILVKITPNDTRRLSTGVYYYTAKLKRGGNIKSVTEFDEPEEIRTLIERTKFIIND